MIMLYISNSLSIPLTEIEFIPIRAQGSGGQNVNKVSSAIHLRFDIEHSSLPPLYKQNLFKMKDSRISQDGIVIIKAQNYRSQVKNREEALSRLQKLIQAAGVIRKSRKPTKPSKKAHKKRVDKKVRRGQIKSLRKKVQ